jgi:ParB-like chromosome segregation protein Spo0J
VADIFPLMSETEFAALKADIVANGLQEPVWLWHGKILDGRHRHRACRELGLAHPIRAYTEGDPVRFVLSKNYFRRHLTPSQLAMVVTKVATLPQGRPSAKAANLPDSQVSQADAARLVHVSERSVRDARKVKAEGQPELVKAVETGTIAVSAAARLANEPVAVQRAVVKAVETGAAKTVTAALTQVKEAANGHPPTRAEGPGVDLLEKVYSQLRIALQDFDALGGLAAVIGRWAPAQRQAFGQRVADIEGLWQGFLRQYRAIPEAVWLTEAEDSPEGRADG